MVLPEGVTAKEWTGPLWPTKRKGDLPAWKFHTMTVPSLEPLTTWFKRGLNRVQFTDSLCPLKERFSAGSDSVSLPSSTFLSTARFSRPSWPYQFCCIVVRFSAFLVIAPYIIYFLLFKFEFEIIKQSISIIIIKQNTVRLISLNMMNSLYNAASSIKDKSAGMVFNQPEYKKILTEATSNENWNIANSKLQVLADHTYNW